MLQERKYNVENLKSFSKDDPGLASAMQAKSVEARKRNAKRRNLIIECGRDILNARMDVSDKKQLAAKVVGYRLGRKATFGEIAFLTIMQKALKDGNYKAFVEMCRLSGMHFDQSPEALGGEKNPFNVQQNTTIAPENVRRISEALEDGC